jgi:hypothetical protein
MTHRLLYGDAIDLVRTIREPIAAVLTDPPYGCRNRTNYSRFKGSLRPCRDYPRIASDDKAFDPSPWLDYPKVVLRGYQHFAERLPRGTILVWNKRRENQLAKVRREY